VRVFLDRVLEVDEQNEETLPTPLTASNRGAYELGSESNTVAHGPELASVTSPQELGELPLVAGRPSKACANRESPTGILENEHGTPASDIGERIVELPTCPTSFKAAKTTKSLLPAAIGHQDSNTTEDKGFVKPRLRNGFLGL